MFLYCFEPEFLDIFWSENVSRQIKLIKYNSMANKKLLT